MVIHLTRVELYLNSKTKSAFVQTIAIINPVAIAKFFYIICKALFLSLLADGKVERGLLGQIFIYFATVEINRHKIIYLHCFV